jgi:hypothetical protein
VAVRAIECSLTAFIDGLTTVVVRIYLDDLPRISCGITLSTISTMLTRAPPSGGVSFRREEETLLISDLNRAT